MDALERAKRKRIGMQYRAVSADGHINETPNTKGHAWIMEDQTRPSVMGFSSFYFKSSKRYDRATLIEGFKNIKDRGIRYEDLFPGSYDAAERVKEMTEGETDA